MLILKLTTGVVGFGMVITSIFMNETPVPKPTYPRDGSKNAALWRTVFWTGIVLMLISMVHIWVGMGMSAAGGSSDGIDFFSDLELTPISGMPSRSEGLPEEIFQPAS